VWFPHAIPKYAFILWLAMQNRLITRDWLIRWGYNGDVKCLFYHNQMESREHMFFECSFNYQIWKFCMLRLPSSLRGCIYNLWCTRNKLKHSSQPSTKEQLLKKIFWEVRSRLAGKRKFPKTRENLTLVPLWNLSAELLL
jgi:hypothetical protein